MASDNLSHWLISTQVRVFLLCVTGKKKQRTVARLTLVKGHNEGDISGAPCVEINLHAIEQTQLRR